MWPTVGRYAWSIGSFGFISPRMRMSLSCSRIAFQASTIRPTAVLASLASRMYVPSRASQRTIVLAADLAGDVDARAWRGRGRTCGRSALLEVKPPSIVRGSSQSRGAMISTNRPSPSRIFLTAATPFSVLGQSRSAGTMSSSWNWTPSKPSSLYALSLRGELDLLADGRAERVGAGADVPGAEREAVLGGAAPLAMMEGLLRSRSRVTGPSGDLNRGEGT